MQLRHFFSQRIVVALLASVLSACGGSSGIAPALQSQSAITQNDSRLGEHARYTLLSLKTLGGTVAAGISITDRDWISGFSTLQGNTLVHAALWRDEAVKDLGTLGGPNSAVEWPNHEERGVVVGISQTASVDKLGEHWSCSAFIPYTGNTCLGFVWQSNLMTPLPTLGGNNGYAAGANNRGEVAGWAENATHDATCVSPQVLQFEAVVWNSNGQPRELAPLSVDPDGAATAINDLGDAVGISGICQNAVGDLSAKHAVLWHDGVAMKIPDLGGAAWNTPAAINNCGEVVGFSDLPGDENGNNPNFHAFRWTKSGGTHDLGVLAGDGASEALGVNDKGQVVGLSCTTAACSSARAFIYRDGVMRDLNSLVPPGSPYLVYANDINNRGEITGLAMDPATGDAFAFRALPRDRDGGENDLQASTLRIVAPQSVAKLGLHLGPFGRVVPQI